MDAPSLLRSQGWRGHGHSLDVQGRGAKKPLLISKKNNVLGVGKKKVDIHADQWWARAFDEGLKTLTAGEVPPTGIVPAVTATEGKKEKGTRVGELAMLANGGRKWLGLYDGFVRGEGLEGTIGIAAEETQKAGKKRKRSEIEVASISKNNSTEDAHKDEQKFKKKAEKKDKSIVSLTSTDETVEAIIVESKESKAERRQRRAERKARREERRQRKPGKEEEHQSDGEESAATTPMHASDVEPPKKTSKKKPKSVSKDDAMLKKSQAISEDLKTTRKKKKHR